MITVFLHHKLLNITPSAGLALLACMPAAIQAADGSAQTFTVKLGDYRYTPDRTVAWKVR
jgi:hypothetical protein